MKPGRLRLCIYVMPLRIASCEASSVAYCEAEARAQQM